MLRVLLTNGNEYLIDAQEWETMGRHIVTNNGVHIEQSSCLLIGPYDKVFTRDEIRENAERLEQIRLSVNQNIKAARKADPSFDDMLKAACERNPGKPVDVRIVDDYEPKVCADIPADGFLKVNPEGDK